MNEEQLDLVWNKIRYNRWPKHMRAEIAEIEDATGVTFTGVYDPIEFVWRPVKPLVDRGEFFLWHRRDGKLRKRRKDGLPWGWK
jgi:hypothetical protein